MLRKTLTILSLIGLLLSAGLLGASYFDLSYSFSNHRDVLSCLAGALVWGHWQEPLGPNQMATGWKSRGFTTWVTWWKPSLIHHANLWWQIALPLWIPCIVFIWLATLRWAIHHPMAACAVTGFILCAGLWCLCYRNISNESGTVFISLKAGGIELDSGAAKKELELIALMESQDWAQSVPGRFGRFAAQEIEAAKSRLTLGWRVGGFKDFETEWLPSAGLGKIRLPMWIPTLMSAVWVGLALAPIRRRRKRRKLGLCLKCGYDLRGSKDRCPECGEAFESPKLIAEG